MKRKEKACKISIVIYLLSILFAPGATALENILVNGVVLDSTSKAPVSDVNITLSDSTISGTSSDTLGHFQLKLKPGTHTLIFSHIGFQKQEKRFMLKKGGKNVNVKIFMVPRVIRADEIRVTAHPDSHKLSSFDVSSSEIKNMTNPLPEVLLSLKTLPGVYSRNDQSTFYNVRGGNYDENLIYLNGIEITQPLLVRKGIAENPSLVNPDMIERINLRTGAFPVRYGDKLSSVLDIRYKSGNTKKLGGAVTFSPVKNTLFLNGPLRRNLTFILGIRQINYGYLFKALQTKGNYSPDFKDAQLGITWSITSHQKIDILGIYASSQFRMVPRSWYSGKIHPEINEITGIVFDGGESFTHKTKALGFNWHFENEKMKVKSGFSSYSQNEKENVGIKSFAQVAFPTFSDSVIFNDQVFNLASSESRNNALDIQINKGFFDFFYSPNWQHQFNFGGELKSFSFKDKLFDKVTDFSNNFTNIVELLDASRKMSSYGLSLYGEYRWKPTLAFEITGGLRFTRYNFNSESLFMPRLFFRYLLSENNILLLALGVYAQPPLYKEFGNTANSYSTVKARKARQLTLGFEHQFENKLNLKIEGYYKNLRDLIPYDVFDVRTLYSGVNDAQGYVYGLEAHIKGDFVPNTISWISYTYLVAREKIYNQEEWYPRPSDQRHTLSAMLQDKMERFPGSKLHIRFLFGSGYPYTNKWLRIGENGERIVTTGKRNHYRIRFYKRFDIGFTQNFRLFERYSIILQEEILNLFDEYNILGNSWIEGVKTEHGLSRRTYNVSINIGF